MAPSEPVAIERCPDCYLLHERGAGCNVQPESPGGAPIRTEFRSPVERDVYFAHLDPDDPVRRQIGAFDFPNIPDAGEAGYRGKRGY